VSKLGWLNIDQENEVKFKSVAAAECKFMCHVVIYMHLKSSINLYQSAELLLVLLLLLLTVFI